MQAHAADAQPGWRAYCLQRATEQLQEEEDARWSREDDESVQQWAVAGPKRGHNHFLGWGCQLFWHAMPARGRARLPRRPAQQALAFGC